MWLISCLHIIWLNEFLCVFFCFCPSTFSSWWRMSKFFWYILMEAFLARDSHNWFVKNAFARKTTYIRDDYQTKKGWKFEIFSSDKCDWVLWLWIEREEDFLLEEWFFNGADWSKKPEIMFWLSSFSIDVDNNIPGNYLNQFQTLLKRKPHTTAYGLTRIRM